MDQVIHQSDHDAPFHLEVNVELDDLEVELLSTLVICFELKKVLESNKKLQKNKLSEIKSSTSKNRRIKD